MASDKKLDQNEQVSYLVDNQNDGVDRTSMLDSLSASTEQREKWERYHLIRDVIQQDYQTPLPRDFAASVSAAIQQEPSIVAFAAPASGDDSELESVADIAQDTTQEDTAIAPAKATVTDFGKARERVSDQNTGSTSGGGWRRAVSGLAVAASVALFALVGLNLWQGNQSGDPLVASVGLTPSTSGGGASSEILGVQPPGVRLMENGGQIEFVSNTGTYWVSSGDTELSPANESRLNMYLSQHLEASPTAGVQGLLPYSRLAGYDSADARQQSEPAE